MPPFVQVLLPTYDGERHLRPLLDSIARQDHRPLGLLVRDDGSRDGTLDVLRDFAAATDLPVEIAPTGPRLGPYRSFFWLLEHADPGADLVALADHDDVWLPDKLSRAVSALDAQHDPVCYGAAVTVTDADLQPARASAAAPWQPSFRHSLFETLAPASTLVLTAATRRLLVTRLPRADVYPDLWCYQVCTALGRFVYDPEPALLYRQHGGNAVGIGTSDLQQWRRRLRRALTAGPGLGPQHWRQLAELRACFGDVLPPGALATLDQLLAADAHWSSRLCYALRGPVVRRSRTDALALRASLLWPRRSKPGPDQPV